MYLAVTTDLAAYLIIPCNPRIKAQVILTKTAGKNQLNERTVVSNVCKFTTGTFPGVGTNPNFSI